MTAAGRRRSERVEAEVVMRAPVRADLDTRLTAGAGRIELGRIIADHDAQPGARCPRCGWPSGGRGQRACPSRMLDRAIRDRRAVPAWLVHLVDDVPGAFAPKLRVADEVLRAAEDELPGLFAPLPRQIPTQGGRS